MKITISLLVAAATIATASAVSVSYNQSFGDTDLGDPAYDVFLTQFDPSLGTLTSATLTLDASSFGSSASYVATAGTGTVTLEVEAQVSASGAFLDALVATPTLAGTSPTIVSPGTYNLTGDASDDTDSNTTFNPADLLLLTGTGTYAFTISNEVVTTSSTTGLSGTAVGDAGEFNGLLTVTYNYTPVPEPSSTALLGLGGLALIMRRRRA